MDIHSHYTAGLASMSILKGIEAGADIVDTAMSPLALGTSHMPTESLVAALQGTDYDTGLDLNQLNVVRAYFAKLREKYIANGQISPKSLGVDANTLLYQVPGGMFSNMLKQLKDAGKEDKLMKCCWRFLVYVRMPVIRRWSLRPARSSVRRLSSM